MHQFDRFSRAIKNSLSFTFLYSSRGKRLGGVITRCCITCCYHLAPAASPAVSPGCITWVYHLGVSPAVSPGCITWVYHLVCHLVYQKRGWREKHLQGSLRLVEGFSKGGRGAACINWQRSPEKGLSPKE